MVIIELFKDIYISVTSLIKQKIFQAIIQNNNPKCKFYSGTKIWETTFEGFNVVFNNVTLYNCKIGRHTYIQKNSKIFNSQIGNFCSIASNVSIGPGLHKTTGVSTHPSFYLKDTPLAITFASKNFFKPSNNIIIGHDVWIGESVIILDGVSIGTGAIIAAGSVVTKDVEPYSIVGGVPAKLLKKRFTSDIISDLLESEWWNFTDNWFKENFELMHNPIEFIILIKK